MLDKKLIWLTGLIILLTRIPFLFNGFGSEEDAWGLILVAENISRSGIYEVSRMPGHPVQEYLLSLIWEVPAWVLNLLTAIVSTLGVVFFMLTLRNWNIINYIPAGILLAFTPVFFINSTNIMDYTWALSLVLGSMYCLSRNKILWAGIILGVACGFRITAGAMVIPFAIYHLYRPEYIKNILILGVTTTLVAIICFVPAFKVYGTDFITYYEYFPYPPFLKNVYKGTIGAWGVTGFAAIFVAAAMAAGRWMKLSDTEKKHILPFVLMSASVLLLYSYSFLRIPQKSAFVIPVIPYLVLLFVLLLNKKQLYGVVAAMLFSCFLLGVNLDDNLRGSTTSSVAIKMNIGNTPVAIDPLTGMVTADHLKRRQKINYAKKVTAQLVDADKKTLIIAGWWQNELNYFSKQNKNPNVVFVYYVNESTLLRYRNEGYRIFFLPEQAYYNDLRFAGEFTEKYATEF